MEGINSRIRSSLLSVQGGILGDTAGCKLGPSLEQRFLSDHKTDTKKHLEADKQYLLSMKHREERTWVQAYLDQEKHILRHMQGE